MLRAALTLISIGLAIYSILDISRTDETDIKLLPKWGWLLICVLFLPIGPIAWLIAGKNRRPRPPRRGRGPIGPDDDPDFLKKL